MKNLSQRLGNTVLLKRNYSRCSASSCGQVIPKMQAHLTPAQLKKGVICASAANQRPRRAQRPQAGHTRCDRDAYDNAASQGGRVRALGGEVVLYGESYSDAYTHAVACRRAGLTPVHPFDDPDAIAALRHDAGVKRWRQLQMAQSALDAVFVAIGGGGLILGVANWHQGGGALQM